MSTAKIVHHFSGETGWVIIIPHKTTEPLVDVVCTIDGVPGQTKKVYAAPHDITSMLVEGLDPVWYYFTAWRSSDGIALDEEINIIAFNASDGSQSAVVKYEYQVDRGEGEAGVWADPVTGDNGIDDTRLKDKTYWVEERVTGTLAVAETESRVDGGFSFTDAEKTMNPDVYYFAFVIVLQAASSGSSGSSAIGGRVILSDAGGETFDPVAMNNKILVASYAISVGVLIFPSLATMPNCYFRLHTNQGAQLYTTLQLNGSDTVWFRKQQVNSINLGQGEEIEISVFDGVMDILSSDTGYDVLGETFWSDKKDTLNSHLYDGEQKNEADYPRVVELMESLEAAAVVDFTTWDADFIFLSVNYGKLNKRKWARNGAGQFRFPDRRDNSLKAIKLTDGSSDSARLIQGPGGVQWEMVGPHYHKVGTEPNPSAAPIDNNFVQGDDHARRSWSAGNANAVGKASTGTNSGTEQRLKTTSQYLCVRI